MHNAITQTEKMPGLSDRYGFISTKEAIDTFEKHGWRLTSTKVDNVRKAEKEGFQKHMLRFRNPQLPSIDGLRDPFTPELIFLNSHDSSAAARIFLGGVRIACLNLVIAGDAMLDFRVVHNVNMIKRLGEGIDYLFDNMPKFFDNVRHLSNTSFTPDAEFAFVRACVDERLKNIPKLVSADYASAMFTRRPSDKTSDAWTIFNRVQESVVRGGIKYTRKETEKVNGLEYDVIKQGVTRKVASINQNVRLNRFVHAKAIELAA